VTVSGAEPQRRLRLYNRRDSSGELRGTFLVQAEQVTALWEESGLGEEIALPLPAGALLGVFRRYGKPLETGVRPVPPAMTDDPEDDRPLVVPLAGGQRARLWRFQFVPYGWVHPADYLLWECPWPGGPDTEPLVAPAPLVASALSALARAQAG
jgi:hypothetical protein